MCVCVTGLDNLGNNKEHKIVSALKEFTGFLGTQQKQEEHQKDDV